MVTLLSRTCNLLARGLLGLCVLLLLTILLALSAQIVSRYVFNAPLLHTDEVAQTALVWLTFLGAALIYREKRHIEVDLVVALLPGRVAAGIAVVLELAVAATLLLVCSHMAEIAPRMLRISYGTLPSIPLLSKFALIYVPLLIGAIATILFALTAVAERLTGSPSGQADPHDELPMVDA